MNVLWALKDVDVQTSTDVPCDVTMHRPDTGVVLVPLENDVAGSTIEQTGLHKLNVTTLCVVCVGDGAVPLTNAFSENMVIVAVKMLELLSAMKGYTENDRTYDGMWGEEMVLHNDSYGTVAAKVVDIPLIFESQVSVVHSRDKSMVVVSTEC